MFIIFFFEMQYAVYNFIKINLLQVIQGSLQSCILLQGWH